MLLVLLVTLDLDLDLVGLDLGVLALVVLALEVLALGVLEPNTAVGLPRICTETGGQGNSSSTGS